MSTSPRPRPRQRGVSLIELIMFMVIMGVAAVAVLQLLNLSTRSSAEPIRRKQALLVAEALMEEVQQARYTFCEPSDANAAGATSATIGATGCATTVENFGPENGESRPYNNVNDYVTADSTAQQTFKHADVMINGVATSGILSDAAGNAMGDTGAGLAGTPLTGFTATVALTPEALGPAGASIASNNTPAGMEVLRITIDVDYGGNQHIKLDGYRTRYAPRTVD